MLYGRPESLTGVENFREMFSMEFYQKNTRVTHRASIALQKFHTDHCLKHLLRIAQQYFVFFSSPKKQTHTICNNRPNIVDLLYRGQTRVAFWFGSIARKGACTVISRSFARSVDIVAWPMQGRFAFRRKVQKLFNDQGKITSNLGHSTSFHQHQKQQCKNCV